MGVRNGTEEQRLSELQKKLEEVREAVRNVKILTLPELLILTAFKETKRLTIPELARKATFISVDIEKLVSGLIEKGLLTVGEIGTTPPIMICLFISEVGRATLETANDFLRLYIID